MLHNTATGTDHIDPTHETIRTRDHERLLSHARARKFLAPDEEWREEAISLIQYLEARGRLVWESFRALTEPCKGRAKSAVILGSVDYDQSQQVTAAMMANSGAVDEIWVPDAKIGTPEDSSLLCYLASRSSYYANALFATLERANELIVAFGIEEFLEVLLSQSKAWSSASKLSCGLGVFEFDFSAVPGKRQHSAVSTRAPEAGRRRDPEAHWIRAAGAPAGAVPHRGR